MGQLIFWISILTSFKKVATFIVVWFQKRPSRAHLYITKSSKFVKLVKLARFSGSRTSSQIWVEVRLPNIRLSGGFDGIYVITAEDFGEGNYFNKIADFDVKSVTVGDQFINF